MAAYHDNERFHPQLNVNLIFHDNSDSHETLLLVLRKVMTCFKSDIQCSAVDLVFGTTIELPGESSTSRGPDSLAVQTCATRLSVYVRNLFPSQTRPQ